MLGRRRKIIKLDYPHFMPDIRQWIKITIDIYIYCPTLWDKKKIEKRSELKLKNENGTMSKGLIFIPCSCHIYRVFHIKSNSLLLITPKIEV